MTDCSQLCWVDALAWFVFIPLAYGWMIFHHFFLKRRKS